MIASMLALATNLVLLAAAAAAEHAPGALPDDPRLAPVKPALEQLVQRAASAGLPADMIVSKVREGLAKGVEPTRIEAAASRLADSLDTAQKYVTARRAGPASTPLVRAVAEARLASVPLEAVDALVRDQRAEVPAPRAVEVVTDLSRRGYPAERAAALVTNVLARDVSALERVSGTLDAIRRDYALSRTEAMDVLARGLASSDSLQGAYSRAAEDQRRQGHGRAGGVERGGEAGDGSPGKSGLAPGHSLTKMKPPTAGPKKK